MNLSLLVSLRHFQRKGNGLRLLKIALAKKNHLRKGRFYISGDTLILIVDGTRKSTDDNWQTAYKNENWNIVNLELLEQKTNRDNDPDRLFGGQSLYLKKVK
ncbi:MAG: hypothetical protein A4E71_00111 [Smithella sp. PtaU1.Bin162]|nr:MAG: hypothetical protein A4E71_00111 [Smithella sp. PtaU1.Bin162]